MAGGYAVSILLSKIFKGPRWAGPQTKRFQLHNVYFDDVARCCGILRRRSGALIFRDRALNVSAGNLPVALCILKSSSGQLQSEIRLAHGRIVDEGFGCAAVDHGAGFHDIAAIGA